jgi:hypothetical protein
MNTLQDIMGLIAKRKIKLPTDKDYIVSAAYTDTQEVLKPQPKMEASLINIGALKKYITSQNTGLGYSGSFYDTTNQTGIAGSVLTMSLNNSDPWNNGVSLVSGSQIKITNPGVYNLAFSAQMIKNSGNTATHTHIWLSQNGVDVPVSASQIGFPSNSIYMVAAWNFFFKTTSANEYVQLKWQIDSNVDNGTVITSVVATGNIPAIPGLIVTVNQVG